MAKYRLRKLVYISGPMSSSGDRVQNIKRGMRAWERLLKAGYAPVLPHLNDFIELTYGHSWDEWIDYDLSLVARCDGVLRLPGYSRGADVETAFAEKQRIPVVRSIQSLKRAIR